MARPPDDGAMPLGDHLEELRSRLIVALASVAASFIVCWLAKDYLMAAIIRPHAQAMRALGMPVSLRLLRYQEGFYAYVKVAALAALLASSPMILHQTWAFVAAGLRPEERRLAGRYGAVSLGLFLAGAAFGFFVLIPLGLRFLAAVGMDVAQPMIAMNDYVSLVVMLTLITGAVFELPLVLRFMVKLGTVEAATLEKHRKGAVLGAFVLGATLTPPDPFTQMLLALPIVALYELGIAAAEPTAKRLLRLGLFAALGLAAFGGLGLRHAWMHQRAAVARELGWRLPVGESVQLAGRPLDLDWRGGATAKVREGSEFTVEGLDTLRLDKGQAFVQARPRARGLHVSTEDVEVHVSDAKVLVRVGEGYTEVVAAEGAAQCYFEGEEQMVLEGRKKRFARGGELADVEEAVKWAR